MAEKNYAQQRASVLENLDGLRVDVDVDKRIGYLILDREPLNIVSYTGRQQIRAIIEEMDEDPDVGVIVIKGDNGVYTSGGDVKAFPDIPKTKCPICTGISERRNGLRNQSLLPWKNMLLALVLNWPWPAISGSPPRTRWSACRKARSVRCRAPAAASASPVSPG